MGNWIKMRHDLIDAPEVRRLARATGLDRDQVTGKLFRLWSWADRHGTNGLLDAEIEDLDDQVGHVGFGAALVSVGWLETQEGGIVIPHWDRHFSDSAKVRALAGQRAEKHRAKRRNAPSVTGPPDGVTQDALPDKNRGDNPPPPPRDAVQDEATLRAAWTKAAKARKVQPYRAKRPPDGLAERLSEAEWLDEALRAIDHLPNCRFFDTPPTMFQLVAPGFVQRVLAGQYDAAKSTPPRGHVRRGDDDRPPPRQFDGEMAERKRLTLAKLADAERAAG